MANDSDPRPEVHTPPQPLSPLAARMWARARREWQQRQFEAAEQSLTNVLALVPDHADAIGMLGVAAQHRGDHVKAIDCFRCALATWPDDAVLHINLGIALYEQGEIAQSLTHLRRACELAPDSPAAWFNLGNALEKQAFTEEALAAFERALELDPSSIPARLSRSRAQASLGQIEAAVTGFRDVLQRDPDNPNAWFGLANLNTIRFDPTDAAQLQHAFTRENLQVDQRELLGSALAKALEDQGDYAQAFEVFGLVKRSQRRWVTGNAAGESDRIELIQRTFEKAMPPPQDLQLGREAILIVSLPRSGSSLVEQILASHPLVEGANEIKDMLHVVDAETRRRGSSFPLWVTDATAGDWTRLGSEYIARTARWRETKPRFTDKHLSNWYLVGAALTMLPAARVVIVRRDPLETCLACYRQYFTAMAGFACDLDDMADYCINFLRLTRFWLDKFPTRVFDLQYESLLGTPEAVIRQLLDFCNLPFDQACVEFHKTPRAVMSTPSAAQVRQPLRHDTKRGARYGDKLDGLRRRLQAAGVLEA